MHRLLNRPSEIAEFMHAVYYNLPQGPLAIATALAYNEAIDQAYGRRAQWMKQNVYTQPWYRLPVGLDTLSRIWR